MTLTPYVKTPPMSAILHRVGLFTRYGVLSWIAFYFAAATTIPYITIPLLIVGFTASLCGASVMMSMYQIELFTLPILIMGIVFVIVALFSQILIITAGLLLVAAIILIERWVHLLHVNSTLKTIKRK